LYAVDDRNSFDSASKWLVEAHGFMKELPPIMIVANKIDLRDTLRQEDMVTTEEGQAFADSVSQKLGAKAVFIETSAKRDKNVDETFETLTRMMIGETEEPRTEFPSVQEEKPATETSVASTSVTSAEPISPTPQTAMTQTPPEAAAPREVDPVTLLASDSEHLQEEDIGRAMAELQTLRSELKIAEEDLTNVLSKLETEMLTLKNTVHVKRIMFDHLKQELKTTREEWAKAYEDYQATEKRRKEEFAKRSEIIEQIRKNIEEAGAKVRTRVGDLEMKKMSEF
jgi:hypothetical protein